MSTLNRSPSRYNSKTPPCISVRLLAIERPSPLPSVLREISPLMNRSVNSSAEIFNCCSDTFFQRKTLTSDSDTEKICINSRSPALHILPHCRRYFQAPSTYGVRLHVSPPLLPEGSIQPTGFARQIFLPFPLPSAVPSHGNQYPYILT